MKNQKQKNQLLDEVLNQNLQKLINFISTKKLTFYKNLESKLFSQQFWEFLNKSNISVEKQAEKTIICNGCENYCPIDYESKLVNGKRKYYVICDKREDIGRVELDKKDITEYQISLNYIAELISSLLESKFHYYCIIPNRAWIVSKLDIGNTIKNIILVNDDPAKVLSEIITDYKENIFVTFSHYDNAVFLSDLIYFKNSAITANSGVIYGKVSTIPKVDYSFKKAGDIWNIVFKGKETNINKLKGLEYINKLLLNQGKEISALELVSGEAVTVFETRDDVLDKKAIQGYKNILEKLEKEISEYEANGMTDKVNRLKKQQIQIEDFLKKNKGKNGSRKFNDAQNRARTSTNKAINTAINNLIKKDPALASHLQNSIKMGLKCIYQPEKLIFWRFY